MGGWELISNPIYREKVRKGKVPVDPPKVAKGAAMKIKNCWWARWDQSLTES
jgi:hypothetical protein